MPQTCNCIAEMDAKLAAMNTKLHITLGFGRDGSTYVLPLIGTEKIETRKRVGPALAIPSFCPFCGVSYQPLPAKAATDRYDEAKELVLGANKVSTSFIQRSLGVRYNEAARYVERMEADLLVGPANNVGRREVFCTAQRAGDPA